MAEDPGVLSGDSPQVVAYALMLCIATGEDKSAAIYGFPVAKADKDWVLDTYAECLRVARSGARPG